MKTLLIGEYREGKLLDTTYELLGFARQAGGDCAMLLVGSEQALPAWGGTLYLADAAQCGEYAPDLHKRLILQAVEKEEPELVVFVHSSYGWDLAPRVAAALEAAQISEVVGIRDGLFETGCCNGKLLRTVVPESKRLVLTIQAGAFTPLNENSGPPLLQPLLPDAGSSRIEFLGYEKAEKRSVDLGSAEIIVSAGRGVGKKENIQVIAALAHVLGGELGASRPVVDAGWLDHGHQVGTTGQVVKPKLYVACGISGAIQHVAGMKGADFVVAINKDRDAPIGEVADVLVVADVMQFVPALTERMMDYAKAV